MSDIGVKTGLDLLERLKSGEMGYSDAEAVSEDIIEAYLGSGSEELLSAIGRAVHEIPFYENRSHLLAALVNYEVHTGNEDVRAGVRAGLSDEDDMIFIASALTMGRCVEGGLDVLRGLHQHGVENGLSERKVELLAFSIKRIEEDP